MDGFYEIAVGDHVALSREKRVHDVLGDVLGNRDSTEVTHRPTRNGWLVSRDSFRIWPAARPRPWRGSRCL
jgi:hypothetical protein